MWGKIFRQIHMEKTWLKNARNYFLHSVLWVGTHCILLTHSGLGQVLSTLPFTGSDPVHAKHTFVTTTVAFAAFKGTFLITVARSSTHQRINENYTKEWRHLPVPFKYVYFIALSKDHLNIEKNNFTLFIKSTSTL